MSFSKNTFIFNGHTLKQKVLAQVTPYEISKVAMRDAHKYKLPNEDFRPNMFKARDQAEANAFSKCNKNDPWMKEIIKKWVELSGLPEVEADFWNHPRFMQSIKKGHSIKITRYLDDGDWGWITIGDSPTEWQHKKRLPEKIRQELLKDKKRA